jgi:hypothetical protein
VSSRTLMAAGLLMDAAAVAAMSAAIVWSSGAVLATSLVAGNVVLIGGFLVAYRGRTRADG